MNLQKRFPICRAGSKYLAAYLCGSASLQDRDKSGSNAGWLGTWESPLRTDSASFKSLQSFIQSTSFCSSWILAVNAAIVSWFSSFLLEDSSTRDSWTFFNSSITQRLLIWASRRSRFCSDNCLKTQLISSELFITCKNMINLPSLRLNNSTLFLDTSSIRIDLKFVLLDLRSNFSENWLFLSFKENPDSFVFHVATWFPFLRRTKFAYGSPRTCVCEKGLSYQQTLFMRATRLSPVRWFFSLLNEQWWR